MIPEILFENQHYVVVNKPSGLLSIPDRHNAELPSLQTWLQKKYPEIFTVHRIDKETSGCICFAKSKEAHQHANQLFEQRGVKKIYHAIVYGSLNPAEGRIEGAIAEHPAANGKMVVDMKKGKPALTTYRVLEDFGKFSLVECELHTGRTHQLRVHLNHIGHSILCDSFYGLTTPILLSSLKKNYHLSTLDEEERPLLKRLALHAFSLSFADLDGTEINAVANMPKDLNAFLNQCRKWLK